MLKRLDRRGRPGWILCDPRDGQPRLWVPFRFIARIVAGRSHQLDYVKPGHGW